MSDPMAGSCLAPSPTMRTCLATVASLLVISALGCAGEEDSTSIGLHKGSSTLAAGDDGQPTIGEHATDNGNPNANTKPNAPSTVGVNGQSFDMALSDAQPAIALGGTEDITVTVTPKNGFTGTVNVAVTGLPANTSAAPVAVTVTSGVATAKLTLKADVTATASAAGASAALQVTGTSGTISSVANANFKVAPKLTLTIPMNVDALRAATTTYRDSWGGAAFGATPTPLKTQAGNGIVVTVYNADSKQHIVHGTGNFPHGNTALPIDANDFEKNTDGTNRTRTLDVGQKGMGYPHDGAQGSGASFQISVAAGT